LGKGEKARRNGKRQSLRGFSTGNGTVQTAKQLLLRIGEGRKKLKWRLGNVQTDGTMVTPLMPDPERRK